MKTKRGSVLIIVLWSLFFLSALALAIDGYIRPRLDLGARLLRKARVHYYAEAGVKEAMLIIGKDAEAEYDCLNDAWCGAGGNPEKTLPGGGAFTLELIDEERKVNINKASYDTLKNLFEIAGEVSSQDAEDLADSVIDWRDEDDDARDNGAEDGYYSIRHPGYDCKNKDFELLEELLLVKGMDRDVLDKVRSRITVHGQGAVNINTADAFIFECLGMTEELAGKIISIRGAGAADHIFDNTGEILEDIKDFEEEGLDLSAEEISQLNKVLAKGLFGTRSDNFLGRAVGKLQNRPDSASITFVYDRNEKKIKYWKET